VRKVKNRSTFAEIMIESELYCFLDSQCRKHRQSYQQAYHVGCTWHPCDLDLWPFDLRVGACRGPAMGYMSSVYRLWLWWLKPFSF